MTIASILSDLWRGGGGGPFEAPTPHPPPPTPPPHARELQKCQGGIGLKLLAKNGA